MPVLITVAIRYFSWGHRLSSSCSSFKEKYLTDDNLLITLLLPETGGISGVTNKGRKVIIYIHVEICTNVMQNMVLFLLYIYIYIYIYIYKRYMNGK